MDELDLWFIDLIERNSRLARLNLRFEQLMKVLERRFPEVNGLRQIQIVKLLQIVAQCRIYLGFTRRWVEDVVVANAFFSA